MHLRQTLYTGQQPSSTTQLSVQREMSRSLAQFIMDASGNSNSFFTGLSATPGTGLTVQIAPGTLYQYGQLDPTAWSGLSADTTQYMLMGMVLASDSIPALTGFAAPGTAGQSINYLIEAQIQVTDAANTNLPFYSGQNQPANYVSKSPSRRNKIVFQVKAGTAATTGSQTTPSADAGWVPLWVVTVDNGESSLTSADITAAPSQPLFLGFVHQTNTAVTFVQLSPASAQTGNINITGTLNAGATNLTALTIPANGTNTTVLLGGATAATNYSLAYLGGAQGDFLNLTGLRSITNGSVTNANASLAIDGAITYTGTHAGTDADPYPISQLNVAQFGGKVVGDFALASGHYIIQYAGTPTADPTNINAMIAGTFQANVLQSNVATGTAPLIVTSSTQVNNLNVQYLQGFQPGNANGNIALNNGTLNANLNANFLQGHQASDFQLAGSYSSMNVTNGGYFLATGSVGTTGGTGSTQIQLMYESSNNLGANGGGALGVVYTPGPLMLQGSTIFTSGPLKVGGDAHNQAIYAGDVYPSGMVRSGFACYRVTRMAGYGGDTPGYTAPGGGADYGVYPTLGGGISLPIFSTGYGGETFSFRTILTLTSAIGVVFNMRVNDSIAIYMDGALQYSNNSHNSNSSAFDCVTSFTIPAGRHTIDIVFACDNTAGDDHFLLFPWIPMPGGQLSSAITSIVPG